MFLHFNIANTFLRFIGEIWNEGLIYKLAVLPTAIAEESPKIKQLKGFSNDFQKVPLGCRFLELMFDGLF